MSHRPVQISSSSSDYSEKMYFSVTVADIFFLVILGSVGMATLVYCVMFAANVLSPTSELGGGGGGRSKSS